MTTSAQRLARDKKTIDVGSHRYHLVRVERPAHYPASFMGHPDYALSHTERINPRRKHI